MEDIPTEDIPIGYPLLVYHPGFNHHHHVGDYGLIVEDYDCYGSVNNDLGVTLVYKDTKRNNDFVCDFKKTRKYLSNLLEQFPYLLIYIQSISSQRDA